MISDENPHAMNLTERWNTTFRKSQKANQPKWSISEKAEFRKGPEGFRKVSGSVTGSLLRSSCFTAVPEGPGRFPEGCRKLV